MIPNSNEKNSMQGWEDEERRGGEGRLSGCHKPGEVEISPGAETLLVQSKIGGFVSGERVKTDTTYSILSNSVCSGWWSSSVEISQSDGLMVWKLKYFLVCVCYPGGVGGRWSLIINKNWAKNLPTVRRSQCGATKGTRQTHMQSPSRGEEGCNSIHPLGWDDVTQSLTVSLS